MTRMLCRSFFVAFLVFTAAAVTVLRPAVRTVPHLPAATYRYADAALPAHFTKPGQNLDNTPADNPLTDAGATLGRVLFYDPRLSANNTRSCGSCHLQAHAFGDPRPFSTGFRGGQTDRRAMPLVNVRYYQRSRFFWDERADTLEDMVLLPISSRIEMGQDLKQLTGTLTRDSVYPGLFERAFGDRQVTEARIGKALAQFVRSIVSYQSRYDEGRARARSAVEDFDNFTRQENRGKALFIRNCATCHMKDSNEHFFVQRPANTGLRRDEPTADGGVGDGTLRLADLGSFKSPSLRNVEVTAPFGHDGRFATLDALIDHYSDNPIVDPSLGYLIPRPLAFTASEKAALIAFLKTLTDRAALTDPKFSNPFGEPKAGSLTRVTGTVLPAGAALFAFGVAASHSPHSPWPLHLSVLVPERPPLPPPPAAQPSHPIVERLEAFDHNGDRRISRDELPERMQGLIARGDGNGNTTLEPGEIQGLVNVAAMEPPAPSVRPQPSTGLPGVVKDLVLPPPRQAAALAIVSAYGRHTPLTDLAVRNVQAKMRAVLDDEEYGNFVAAVARLSRAAGK